MPRKRRHSRSFIDHDTSGNSEDRDRVHSFHKKKDVWEDKGARSTNLDKEREIWDAFREEHYEAIEQLPLSLHRQYILMQELDEQGHKYNSELLPTVEKYVLLRQSMAGLEPKSHPVLNSGQDSVAIDTSPIHQGSPAPLPLQSFEGKGLLLMPVNGSCAPATSMSRSSPPDRSYGATQKSMPTSVFTTRITTPSFIPQEHNKPPQTTRELLSRIAWLSEENLRASEEKLNLAQAAVDSVYRHIRLLDQAIKEQETSLQLGIRPGTHPAPIVLPDLVVPKWARQARTVHSPTPSLSGDLGVGGTGAEGQVPGGSQHGHTLGIVSSEPSGEGPLQRRKGGKKGRGKWKRSKPVMELGRGSAMGIQSATLTVPSLVSVPTPFEETSIDPDEQRYCYCYQISYGQMIACDNPKCEREWFHLGCAGLTEAPKGKAKWYCRNCKEIIGSSDLRGRLGLVL